MLINDLFSSFKNLVSVLDVASDIKEGNIGPIVCQFLLYCCSELESRTLSYLRISTGFAFMVTENANGFIFGVL